MLRANDSSQIKHGRLFGFALDSSTNPLSEDIKRKKKKKRKKINSGLI